MEPQQTWCHAEIKDLFILKVITSIEHLVTRLFYTRHVMSLQEDEGSL